MNKNIVLLEAGNNISLLELNQNIWSLFDALDINPNTLKDYKMRTALFTEYLQSEGINRNTYIGYKKYLDLRSDFSVSTKAKYLTVSKIILKELNRLGYLPADITSTTKGFKQSKKHKKDGLNDEEMATLINAVKSLPISSNNSRLKAILGLLIFQGLRQVEITRLDAEDIDLNRNTALVQGKGRDDKEIIYLHPETVSAINEYLRAWKIKSGALFPSQSNNSKQIRLTTRSIRGIVKNYLTSLGIAKTTHGFRHYFTTTLIKTYKGDLLEVAQYTRHRGLEMLQVYNDTIRHEADLPRYYSAFNGVSFSAQNQAPTSDNSNYRK